jgi:NADH-quinone oxidoreductase subunit L
VETIILFAPLVGALICGFGWRLIGEQAAIVTATALLFLAAVLSWVVFLGHHAGEHAEVVTVMRFIDSGLMDVDWAIRVDTLSVVMFVVVNTVSALVHLYSFGYMDHDPQWKEGEVYKPRFFAYLSFFTFAMLSLVSSDNLLQMFFGWEGVGVASYLLIGFYYRKPSAGAAAMKAFIVNRVGDFGFALGIFALFFLTDSIQFDVIFENAADLASTEMTFLGWQVNAAETVALLLFIGAMGKSAQLILHTWLPDAMEGPTPVSALIHAATMVTAGVFLVCRMSPVMEYAPGTLGFVTMLGAMTAFFAATVGLVQNDIKRVIAYSTCSQLGYMFAAAGVGFYQAAMFHLFTHAAFKAMLFLGAGSVIHAMHHEQDMRAYGGLRKKIPVTFWAMMIGTLAITGVGIPFSYDLLGVPVGFAGFVSKDAIIEGVYAGHATGAFWLLVLAALMTSFYSWRLMFMTFYGAPKVFDGGHGHGHDAHGHDAHGHDAHEHDAHGHDAHGHGHDDHGHGHDHGHGTPHDHAQESPRSMTIPLMVLAVGAVLAGMVFYGNFVGHHAKEFFGAAIFMGPENHVLHDYHEVPDWVKLAPFVAMLLGLGTAYWFYVADPSIPGRLAAGNPVLYRFLLNKWYFDEIYDAVLVRPARALGRFLWKTGDGATIDGGINGLAMGVIPFFTRIAVRVQSGYLFHYAFAMFIGLALLITWMAVRGAN